MQMIRGTQNCINNLMMQQDKFLRAIGEAVEKTCVDVANDAKKGHAGNMAHASKRYQNQTTNLTRAITPELETVSYRGVKGLVHTAGVEYALWVEIKTGNTRAFPFMYPALMGNKDNYEDRLKKALRR